MLHNIWASIYFCLKEKTLLKPKETPLMRLYRIEHTKDYDLRLKNGLEMNDDIIKELLGYPHEPKRKKIFGFL